MGNVVIAINPNTGEIYNPHPSKEEWESIRVESKEIVFTGGLVLPQNRSALLSGPREALEAFLASQGVNPVEEGAKLPGRIVAQESTIPFWENQLPKINPEKKTILMLGDEQIFRQTVYDPSGELTDSLIQYDAEVDIDPADYADFGIESEDVMDTAAVETEA
jgi:hypothetical protein